MKNFMKTFLCFTLILGMLLCLSACGSSEKDSASEAPTVKQYITGRYELQSITWKDGTVATGKTLQDSESAMGDMYVQLYSDGTAQLSLLGQIMDMEFENNEMRQINNPLNTYDMTVGSGKVTLTKDGDTFVFVKQ